MPRSHHVLCVSGHRIRRKIVLWYRIQPFCYTSASKRPEDRRVLSNNRWSFPFVPYSERLQVVDFYCEALVYEAAGGAGDHSAIFLRSQRRF